MNEGWNYVVHNLIGACEAEVPSQEDFLKMAKCERNIDSLWTWTCDHTLSLLQRHDNIYHDRKKQRITLCVTVSSQEVISAPLEIDFRIIVMTLVWQCSKLCVWVWQMLTWLGKILYTKTNLRNHQKGPRTWHKRQTCQKTTINPKIKRIQRTWRKLMKWA